MRKLLFSNFFRLSKSKLYLRTPLTSIWGYLDLLETEEKSEKVTGYVMAVQNRAEVLKQLLEELLSQKHWLNKCEERLPHSTMTAY